MTSSPDPFREMQPRKDSVGNTRAPKPWWRAPDIPDLEPERRETEEGEDDDASGFVPEPVGRWLTEEKTEGDIDALRDTRSGSSTHHTPDRRNLFGPLLGAVAGALVVLLWQFGLFGIFGSDPDVQTALAEAGISSITATVDGDTAILSGLAESESAVDSARIAALRVDGIAQVRSDVRIIGSEPPSSIASSLETRVQTALSEAGLAGVTVQVSGDTAVVRGTLASSEDIDTAASLILGVDGIKRLDNRLAAGVIAPVASDNAGAASAALDSAGFASLTVTVTDGVAIVTGSVVSDADRAEVATILTSVTGVDSVDNRVTVAAQAPATTTVAVPTEDLQVAAEAALAAAGYGTVTVTMDGTTAMLGGTVPVFAIGAGFFEFSEGAEAAVLQVEGIEAVRSRLTLRGDGAALRADLKELIEATPIVFESGSAELAETSSSVLDEAAAIINAQPGLTVLIAGHTDTAGSSQTNELLARGRAESVLFYLLSQGVPPYRMAVVSYGELFPGQDSSDAENRRIEFEVGP